MTTRTVVGVDLGGTQIKAVAMTEDGDVLARYRLPTGAGDGRDAVLARVVEAVNAVRAEVQAPVAVGLSVPGVIDAAAGRVELTVALTPDWNGFDVTRTLAPRLGLPVHLANDAQAATLGEHVWGAGRPYRDFVCITVGTGIGGGLVVDGRLYTGSRGMAGVLGHTTVLPDGLTCGCGNRGCLETVAGGTAIANAAKAAIAAGAAHLRTLVGTDEPAPELIACAARAGDETARAIFARAGTFLGVALGTVVCLLNPQAIVVGGGVSAAGDLLLDPLRRELRARTSVFSDDRGGVDVVPSPLGSEAGAIGSAAWALRAGQS